MTARQFVSSAACLGLNWAAQKSPHTRRFFRHFLDFVFPRFIWNKAPWRPLMSPGRIAALIWIAVFVMTFVVQACWAWHNGVLWAHPVILAFSKDTPNLLNYIFVCELYSVFGVLFIIEAAKLDQFVDELGVPRDRDDPIESNSLRGAAGFVAIPIIAALACACYGSEILAPKSVQYWFMEKVEAVSGQHRFSTAGYYYLFVNLFLLMLVIWAAIAHAGLFRAGGRIARHIRTLAENPENPLLKPWLDEKELIPRLAPFSRTIVLSKAFVFSLLLNMLTWKHESGTANVARMYLISAVVLSALGIWVFSLPRYAVQLELFRAKRLQLDKDEYKDIRPTWLLGMSAALDVLIFSFLLSRLFNAEIAKAAEHLFS